MEDLVGKIELILDGGMVGVGLESTVLDLTGEIPTVLRPGGVTLEQLQEVLPEVRVINASEIADANKEITTSPGHPSPGVKYAHYAPDMPLMLIEGRPEDIGARIIQLTAKMQTQGTRVGVLATLENLACYQEAEHPPELLRVMGSRHNMPDIALYLFKILRECDLADVDVILVEGLSEEGLGLAIMDRLRRACAGQILRV
jgi:L-threonylcarbamoyladenylate synthase